VGWRSDRRMTKSSMVALSKAIGPWTRSWNVVPPAGTLKRTARGRPARSRAATHPARARGRCGRRSIRRTRLPRRRASPSVRRAGSSSSTRGPAPRADPPSRVTIEPPGLQVRRVRPADDRALVPVETEPAQTVENARDHLVGRSLQIGVLDAQHEHAARVPREQPVEERGTRAADVEVASGGGANLTRINVD